MCRQTRRKRGKRGKRGKKVEKRIKKGPDSGEGGLTRLVMLDNFFAVCRLPFAVCRLPFGHTAP
jgi:hypothetical protein